MRVYYKPTEEAINNINPRLTSGLTAGDPLERAKTIVIVYAMQDHSKDSIDSVYFSMYYHLKHVYDVVRYRIRKEYYEQMRGEKEISFEHPNGWGDSDWDYDEVMSQKTRWFVEQAILCPTADYYEDSERFDSKEGCLDQEVDVFIESMQEVCVQEIEVELEPFKDREEKDDDY